MISNWKISIASKILVTRHSYYVNYHIIFTISSSVKQQLTYPPCVSHTFSSARLSSARILLMCPPETFQPDSFNEDEHQCQNILHSFLSFNSPSIALPCFRRLSPSSHLDVSPALLLSELLCGVYTLAGLRALVTASLRVYMCVCVWVVVCQLICACVGWGVVSLLCVTHADTLALTEGVAVV